MLMTLSRMLMMLAT